MSISQVSWSGASFNFDDRGHFAVLAKPGDERFRGEVVPQQRAIASCRQRSVDNPLLIANGNAKTDHRIRRRFLERFGDGDCRQVMRRRNRPRSRSMNSGAYIPCPTAVCRSSRPSGFALKSPPVCSARHSGNAKGITWASGRADAAGLRPAVALRPCNQKTLAAIRGDTEVDMGSQRE